MKPMAFDARLASVPLRATPLPGLIAAEAEAKAVLEDVRVKPLAEITKAINRGAEPELPKQT
jgi:hypothetical protein